MDDVTQERSSEGAALFDGLDLASFHGGGTMPPGSAEACPFWQAAAGAYMDPERLMDLFSQLVKSAGPADAEGIGAEGPGRGALGSTT